MAFKVEIKGQFFRLSDTVTEQDIIRIPAASCSFIRQGDYFAFIDNSTGQLLTQDGQYNSTGGVLAPISPEQPTPVYGSAFLYTDLVDAALSPYASADALDTFLSTNVGGGDSTTVIVNGKHSDLILDDGTNPHGTTKADVGLSNVDNTSDADKPVSTAQQSALDAKIDSTEKGAANGVATLDAGGKIPSAQLPLELMEFKGNWNAATNTPALANTDTDAQGNTYRVSVAGAVDFGAGAISFEVGDWVYNNGTEWQKGDNTDAVASVFGRTGVITSQAGDYTADQITNAFDKSTDTTDNITEGAANKFNVNADWNAVSGDAEILNKPATFPPSPHTHVAADVTDFNTAVDNNASVVANTAKVSFPEAPNDGQEYVRKNLGWAVSSGGGGGAPADMAVLVVERTTSYAVTGTYQELSFDTTGTENDPAVLEHNDVQRERIEVKTAGIHQIALSLNCDNTANQNRVLEAELRVNGTPVKTLNFTITKGSEELATRITAVNLPAGSYVTFAVRQQGGGTDLTLNAPTVFYFAKMQGTKGDKGDKGDTGAGSNIIVQKDDVTVGTVTDTLNFEGAGVSTVVDEGANKTTVTITGGGGGTWQPEGKSIMDWSNIAGTSFAIDLDLILYRSFPPATDSRIVATFTLDNNIDYDGSDLALLMYVRLSTNGGAGDTLAIEVSYAMNGVNDVTAGSRVDLAQVDTDVSTWLEDEVHAIQSPTITGVAGKKIITIQIKRNGQGGQADSYGGDMELIGAKLIKV